MRAHPEPFGYQGNLARSPVVSTRTAVALFVVPAADRALYTGDQYSRLYAHTADDALRLLATNRPRVVVADWDDPEIKASEICAAAQNLSSTSVLVTTADVSQVPKILKAGCHGILLKPFAPNLLAARLGRVVKETETTWGSRPVAANWQTGTNRVWPDTACPNCGARGATSFDFSSYRRMWYACLSCEHTWLGQRQE